MALTPHQPHFVFALARLRREFTTAAGRVPNAKGASCGTLNKPFLGNTGWFFLRKQFISYLMTTSTVTLLSFRYYRPLVQYTSIPCAYCNRWVESASNHYSLPAMEWFSSFQPAVVLTSTACVETLRQCPFSRTRVLLRHVYATESKPSLARYTSATVG